MHNVCTEIDDKIVSLGDSSAVVVYGLFQNIPKLLYFFALYMHTKCWGIQMAFVASPAILKNLPYTDCFQVNAQYEIKQD